MAAIFPINCGCRFLVHICTTTLCTVNRHINAEYIPQRSTTQENFVAVPLKPDLKHLFTLASQLGDGMQMKRQRWRQSAPQNNGQEPGSHGATALDPNPGIQRKTRHRQALKGGSVGLRGFVVDGWRSITTWIGLTNDSQAKESAAPEERTAGGFSGRHQSGSRHRTLHNSPPHGYCIHTHIYIPICVSCVQEQQENGGKIVASSTRAQHSHTHP